MAYYETFDSASHSRPKKKPTVAIVHQDTNPYRY